jgi:hypothetical protein
MAVALVLSVHEYRKDSGSIQQQWINWYIMRWQVEEYTHTEGKEKKGKGKKRKEKDREGLTAQRT